MVNKTWLKQEVLRLFLSGESQENISIELNISVGTVNNFIGEFMKSDNTIELQRRIAIISKKKGVSIPQIAANMRWKNRIKEIALDDKKIEKFVNVMDMLGNKHSIPPTALANRLFSIIEITLRENIEPHKLDEVIKSKISELQEINNQVEDSNKVLEDTKATVEEEQKSLKIKQKDLDQFRQITELLKFYEHPELSTEYGAITKALIDIKSMGYDPKVIVSKYEKFESLTKAIEKLEKKLGESTAVLQRLRHKSDEENARWKDYDNAFEIFNRLVKDGLKEEDILMAAHVLKNDFPQNEIKQLIEDIRTYGNVATAISILRREYEGNTEFLSDILKNLISNGLSDG